MVQSSSSQYPRALIVEDETMIALGLEAQLRELGFQACDLAADGHQALSRAMSNRPNVVLMDVNLEGNREGIEVARRLRETYDVPIVFVTGCTDSETIEGVAEAEARKAGSVIEDDGSAVDQIVKVLADAKVI